LAKARDKWLDSKEGLRMSRPYDKPLARQFLKNRLEAAFLAGWEACVDHLLRNDSQKVVNAVWGAIRPKY
jgi:hypothetical protein